MDELFIRQQFASLAEQLEEVKDLAHTAATRADEVRAIASETLEHAKATNGRVNAVEEELWGSADERRRGVDPGIVSKVENHDRTIRDVRAVTKAGWAVLGLLGLSGVALIVQLIASAGA